MIFKLFNSSLNLSIILFISFNLFDIFKSLYLFVNALEKIIFPDSILKGLDKDENVSEGKLEPKSLRFFIEFLVFYFSS